MKIDWSRLALNIRAAGMPLRTASKRVGANPGFVAQLSRGEVAEPKFSQGLVLLDLHHDVCGAEKTRELAE